MGAQENECQISQNYIFHVKISEFYLCFHNSCEIWHSLSQTPMRNFTWCYYRWLITSLGLKKCKKNAIFFKLFWYKVFIHWELKITQFPGGFHLKTKVFKLVVLSKNFSIKWTPWTFLLPKRATCTCTCPWDSMAFCDVSLQ